MLEVPKEILALNSSPLIFFFMFRVLVSRQLTTRSINVASQTNKEWKPKSTQKQSSIGPGVIGTPAKLTSPADVPKNLETDAVLLQDKFSRVNISENQNVIIAAHIRVSETDRSRMIFGSLGTEFESSRNPSFQAIEGAEVSHIEPSARFVSYMSCILVDYLHLSLVVSSGSVAQGHVDQYAILVVFRELKIVAVKYVCALIFISIQYAESSLFIFQELPFS